MKTKVVKRVVALTLAGLIILGTLGYFFSVVGFAAESSERSFGSSYRGKYEITKPVNCTKISANDEIGIKLTITSVPTTSKIGASSSIELKTNGAFTKTVDASSGGAISQDGANWVVTFTAIKYTKIDDSTRGKLEFSIDSDNLSVDIDECKTNSGGNNGGNSGNDDPQPTLPANMSYTISRIYRNAVSVDALKKDKIDAVSRDDCSFFIGDSSKNDPSITQGRYVMAQVQFAIPGVKKTDIIEKKIVNGKQETTIKVDILVDRGGFRFQSASEGYIHIDNVQETTQGVICVVTLMQLQYTGDGNTLAFTVRSNNDKADPFIFEQFSTEVSSCVPRKKDTGSSEEEDPDYSKMEMATPYVIVSNYSYGGQVTAGDTFPLELTFYNTSRSLDVTNMMITITMPDAFMLTSSSNTFYVDQLDAQQSVSQTVRVTAKANAAPQSHNIEVSMKYQYIDDHLVSRRDNSTQETISIPVVQIDRFQVTGVEVSQEIYLNEESYLTVNFVNKGRSDVYNLSAQISGDIQNPGQQQNLGNLTSGSTGTADFYITPNGEGVCAGEVTITYEDTNMVEKTATIQWSTNVVDPMAGMDFGPGMMEDPTLTDEKKSPAPFIIGGVVVAGGVAAFLIRRRILKKRSEEADANL